MKSSEVCASVLWDNVIEKRIYIIAFCLMLAAISSLSFDRLYFDNSDEIFFLPGDKNIEVFYSMTDRFGDPEYLTVGVEARDGEQDVFDEDILIALSELTHFLNENEHVINVKSIITYRYTKGYEGGVETEDVFQNQHRFSTDDIERAKQVLSQDNFVIGRLLTENLKHSRILAKTEYRPGENDHNVKLMESVFEFIKMKNYTDRGIRIRLSGGPLISERFETISKNDMSFINPVMAALLCIIMFMCFGSIIVPLMILLVVGVAFILVTAIQALLGWPFTPVNTALIPTIIIIGMSSAIHVVVTFFKLRRSGDDKKYAAKKVIVRLIRPLGFTALTTFLGFFMLSVTELLPIKQYALLASFGVLVVFLLCVTMLPAMLSFYNFVPSNSSLSLSFLAEKIISYVTVFVIKNRIIILSVSLFLGVYGAYASFHIKADTNYINYFKNDSWLKKDLKYFDTEYKGVMNFEFVIDSGISEGVYNPNFLLNVERFQRHIQENSEMGKILSFVDYIKRINREMNGGREENNELPESPELIAQYMFLLQNSGPEEDMSEYVDAEARMLRLSVPSINLNSSKTEELLNRIHGIINEYKELDISVTGLNVLYHVQNTYVNRGMIRSFIFALMGISLAFFILFRSIKYGLVALIPSVIPIVLVAGTASLLGITLDLGTMIVGAMTLGIAVDDSIHVLNAFIVERKRGSATAPAIFSALQESGKAVLLTSTILIGGFSVMTSASFIPYIYTGLFSAMIMFLALLGDLFVLPSLLSLIERDSATDMKEGQYESVFSL